MTLHEAQIQSGPAVGVARLAVDGEALLSVTALASELGITARALRFYEDKGLIAPRRLGAVRVYSHRERARMILILRGKTLGFSLREIKDYLDLYDADPQHEVQTRALLGRIAERRHQLEAQRDAIDQALRGLADLERDAEAMLKSGNRGRAPARKPQALRPSRPAQEGSLT
jgi:DNA-binding transcriptional MerR regulator